MPTRALTARLDLYEIRIIIHIRLPCCLAPNARAERDHIPRQYLLPDRARSCCGTQFDANKPSDPDGRKFSIPISKRKRLVAVSVLISA